MWLLLVIQKLLYLLKYYLIIFIFKFIFEVVMKLLFFLILLIPYIASAQIDKMSVTKKAGGADEIPLYSNQQITFESATDNDEMYVKKKDGTTDVYKLSDLNAIIFDGVASVEEDLTGLFKVESYPNPFQESTNIAYSLEKQAKVELNIFDINGNLINSLINQIQETGNYTIKWESTNSLGIKVSAGIYYYQLKVDNTSITKQTIFIK
jgi:hypothetical protein